MELLTFNKDDGFTEVRLSCFLLRQDAHLIEEPQAVVRGYRSGILDAASYSNLGQCDSLEGTEEKMRGEEERRMRGGTGAEAEASMRIQFLSLIFQT